MQPEMPEDMSYFTAKSSTYISLALCQVGSSSDQDDGSLELGRMFSQLEGGTRLLIVGQPGSGKTALMHNN